MREGSRPELVVGIDRAQPIPMQMGSPETGDLRGFEVELLNAIADDLGRNIVYRTEDWSVLMARLSAGDLDIICSAATVSAERSEQVAFCTPHLKISLALVNRLNGHLVPFLREARIGVRQGTTAERYAERNYTSSELSMISESNEELYLALAHGQLDAVIDDSPIALHFSQTIEGLEYRGPLDGTDGEYAIMTGLHNVGLKEQINATLEVMESDGRLREMRGRWFGKSALTSQRHNPHAEPSDDQRMVQWDDFA